MCLIPLSLLSHQRKVQARQSWGWKLVFGSVWECEGSWFGLDVVSKTMAKEPLMGWHHTSFTSNQTDPLYQTSPQSPIFSFVHSIRLQASKLWLWTLSTPQLNPPHSTPPVPHPLQLPLEFHRSVCNYFIGPDWRLWWFAYFSWIPSLL